MRTRMLKMASQHPLDPGGYPPPLEMRSYVVSKYSSDLSVPEIVLVTAGCCAGLILMVAVFWGISKPSSADRVELYFSRKHDKRARRRSSAGLSVGAGQAAMTSSLGHSLDQSVREKSGNDSLSQHANLHHTDTAAADDATESAESSAASNGHQVELEQSGKAGSGYGATTGFNYTVLKDEDP